mmetsp:Transcript_38374/g.80433  ORF Transcript_38374/g.80433 Transcript_38374/m.80433 type:complete len:240 (+) Transcript_38374:95-814(+)
MKDRGTRPNWASCTRSPAGAGAAAAGGVGARSGCAARRAAMTERHVTRSWMEAMSALLSMTRSAASTCSSSSSITGRAAAHSSTASPPRSRRSPSRRSESHCAAKSAASTTVTTPRTSAPAAAARLRRTAAGSATPESSTRMWSNGSPLARPRETRSCTDVSSSSLAEQHAHPFCSSTAVLLATAPRPRMRRASMLTSATSLTTTPTFRPCLFSRICLRVLVFPVPKNPESRVIGVSSE